MSNTKLIGRDEVSGIARYKVENPSKRILCLCESPPFKTEEVVTIGAAYDPVRLAFREHLAGIMDFLSEKIGPYLAYDLNVHQGMAGAHFLSHKAHLSAKPMGVTAKVVLILPQISALGLPQPDLTP
jgi:hypothetical protein